MKERVRVVAAGHDGDASRAITPPTGSASSAGQPETVLSLLSVSGAGREDVNGEYQHVCIDLGRLGGVQRNAVYRKVDDESVMIVLFRYRPSMCCFFDPGCAMQQASFIGPRRARWAIVRCAQVSPESRQCWKCGSWRDCMGGFAPQSWSVDEMVYVSAQQRPRVSLQTNGVLAVDEWEDSKLALLNGSGHCSGTSPPPRIQLLNTRDTRGEKPTRETSVHEATKV